MRVWRLCRRQYAVTAFSGIGAKLWGGRWNAPGYPVVYTADSLALAALETFVHLDPDLLSSAGWVKTLAFRRRL
jgi:RES domain-containing protein